MRSFDFCYPVRLDDLDFMGIVGNAEWVTLLTRARTDLLDKIDFPFSEMMKQKVGGVVADMSIKFIMTASFGDILTITITPKSPFKKGLTLAYQVRNQNNEECLSADIKIIFVNEAGRPVIMPERIAINLFGTNVNSQM